MSSTGLWWITCRAALAKLKQPKCFFYFDPSVPMPYISPKHVITWQQQHVESMSPWRSVFGQSLWSVRPEVPEDQPWWNPAACVPSRPNVNIDDGCQWCKKQMVNILRVTLWQNSGCANKRRRGVWACETSKEPKRVTNHRLGSHQVGTQGLQGTVSRLPSHQQERDDFWLENDIP